MRAKYKFQVVQDTCLLLILLSLMGFHLWGDIIHEWLAVAFFALIMLHCGLNTHWFNRLAQGEYSPFRVVQVTLNGVLLITLLIALTSGIILSRHLFYDFPFHHPSDVVRKIHMTSVHWMQVIAAIHLGMHWKMLASFFCSVMNIEARSLFASKLMPLLFLALTYYGGTVFIAQDLLAYLAAQVDFAFFAYQGAGIRFYVDYVSVVVFIAYSTRILLWLLFFRRAQQP